MQGVEWGMCAATVAVFAVVCVHPSLYVTTMLLLLLGIWALGRLSIIHSWFPRAHRIQSGQETLEQFNVFDSRYHSPEETMQLKSAEGFKLMDVFPLPLSTGSDSDLTTVHFWLRATSLISVIFGVLLTALLAVVAFSEMSESKLVPQLWSVNAFIAVFSLILFFVMNSLFLWWNMDRIIRIQHQAVASELFATKASLSKSNFIRFLGHELRNPLHSIFGLGYILNQGGERDRKKEIMVEAIVKSAESIERVLDDVILMSRFEDSTVTVVNQDFTLDLLLKEISKFASALFKQTCVKWVDSLEIPSDVNVRADIRFLACALRNIVLFGFKVSSSSHGLALCHGSFDTKLSCLLLKITFPVYCSSIRDYFVSYSPTYSSISRNHVLFETSSPLSLPLAYRIIELLGGRIFAYSKKEPSDFTTIEASIPLSVLSSSSFVPKFEMPEPLQSRSYSSELIHEIDSYFQKELKQQSENRCMIVEDDAFARLMASTLLNGAGFLTDCVEDGQAAVDLWTSKLHPNQHWTCVLMDLDLPKKDGITATKELRALGAHIPIIALTANVSPSIRESCLKAGMDEFFAKPLQPTVLIEFLQSQRRGA